MEDCHSVKLSRLLALTVLVLNGSLFRNLTLVSYWASRSALFFSSALSGSSWAGYRNVLWVSLNSQQLKYGSHVQLTFLTARTAWLLNTIP